MLGWNQAANEHAWNLGCPCDAMTPCPACQAAPSPPPAAPPGRVLQRLPAALLREWHALAKFEHWASCTEHYHGITRAVPVRYLCNTQVSPVHDLCITMALPVHHRGITRVVTCALPWHYVARNHASAYLLLFIPGPFACPASFGASPSWSRPFCPFCPVPCNSPWNPIRSHSSCWTNIFSTEFLLFFAPSHSNFTRFAR